MKTDDLLAIVDFLYYGEANIYQENFDNFLTIAEELNLKGLNGKELNESGDKPNFKGPRGQIKQLENKISLDKHFKTPQQNTVIPENISETQQLALGNYRSANNDFPERAVALPKEEYSGELQELDKTIKSMMVLGENMLPSGRQRASVCKVCGKEGQHGSIKDHIEANHIEGIIVPCNICEKTFRSRASLRHHKINQH